MNYDKGLIAGSSALLVLSLLKEQERYGYELIKTLKDRSNDAFDFKEGTLYPILHKMENEGWIRSENKTVNGGQDESVLDVTYENGQARVRTLELMDTANRTGGLVVGTGDLSELALGWATYNGDHMSMYGVNAGVPKTLVRHLVRYEADIAATPALKEVLLDILDTPARSTAWW